MCAYDVDEGEEAEEEGEGKANIASSDRTLRLKPYGYDMDLAMKVPYPSRFGRLILLPGWSLLGGPLKQGADRHSLCPGGAQREKRGRGLSLGHAGITLINQRVYQPYPDILHRLSYTNH